MKNVNKNRYTFSGFRKISSSSLSHNYSKLGNIYDNKIFTNQEGSFNQVILQDLCSLDKIESNLFLELKLIINNTNDLFDLSRVSEKNFQWNFQGKAIAHLCLNSTSINFESYHDEPFLGGAIIFENKISQIVVPMIEINEIQNFSGKTPLISILYSVKKNNVLNVKQQILDFLEYLLLTSFAIDFSPGDFINLPKSLETQW